MPVLNDFKLRVINFYNLLTDHYITVPKLTQIVNTFDSILEVFISDLYVSRILQLTQRRLTKQSDYIQIYDLYIYNIDLTLFLDDYSSEALS